MKKIMPIWVITMIIAALAAILFALNNFRQSSEKNFTSDIYMRLEELSENNAGSIRSKVNDQFAMLHTLAKYIAYEDLHGEGVRSVIEKTVDSYGFLRCALTFPDGSFLTHDGKSGDASLVEYTAMGFQGISSVTGPRSAVVDSTKTVILLTVPIYQGEAIAALLTCTYETSYLDTAFQTTSFGGKGYSYITDADGTIISEPADKKIIYDGDNILSFFRDKLDTSYSKIESDILNGKSDTILLNIDGNRKYLSYQPLGINRWYVFSVAAEEVLNTPLNAILTSVYSLSAVIIAALLVMIFTIALYIQNMRKKASDKLSALAYYDVLTGMPNRNLFEKEARRILDTVPGDYAYIILNVNKFKLINDIFGFPQGDCLLRHIAGVLQNEKTKNEVCARFESDIFHIISACPNKEFLEKRMLEVAEKIGEFNFDKNVPHKLSVGFGAYCIENKSKSISLMGDKARMALSKIKGIHSATTYFYNDEIINQFMAEQEIENAMQSALTNGEMNMYLQPKCSSVSSKVHGAEALVRWQHPDKGIIMPDKFIPLFEKNGFIIQLDMYMVEAACKKLREWQDKNLTTVPISVNQSRACLYQHAYIRKLTAILNKYNVSPSLIEIEVTERAFFEDETALVSIIEQLHSFGFNVAMDDFGAGYSSLNMLQDVLVDVLKIDKNFFKESINSERGKKIVSNIVSMANDLNIEVVAEGIETKEQLEFLREINCGFVQGYYFSRPIPADAFEKAYCKELKETTVKE